jgi:hypothetical protein
VVLGSAFAGSLWALWWIPTCSGYRSSLVDEDADPVKVEKDLMKIVPQDRWILFTPADSAWACDV